MDNMELKTSVLHECDGFRLKSVLYFEGKLPDGSSVSKHYSINDDNHYREVTFGKEVLSITNRN